MAKRVNKSVTAKTPKVSEWELDYPNQLLIATSYLAKKDPKLKQWIKTFGPCKLQVKWDKEPYEALISAVTYQQLHRTAAATILGRFCAGFRGHPFPSPRQVAKASLEQLRSFGLSAAKATAIQGIAAAVLSGELPTRERAGQMTDAELIECITQLRGIGRWTVEMLLIFSLGRLDVMPVDDFAVRHGYRVLHGADLPVKPRELTQLTAHWAPYRSVGAWYLWRRYEAHTLETAENKSAKGAVKPAQKEASKTRNGSRSQKS